MAKPQIDVGALLAEAVGHHQAGRLEHASRLYAAVLQAEPDHPDALNLAGVAAGQAGDFARAEALVRRAIMSAPRIAQYHNNLALALKNQGRMQEAAAAFEQALALDPRSVEALCNLAVILHEKGDTAGAAVRLEAAVAAKPDAATAHALLGAHLFDRGRWAEAERHLRRAASLSELHAYGAGCFLADDYEALASAADFAPRLAAMPPVSGEMPGRERPGFVVCVSCDARYFHEFARAVPLSADQASPGMEVHLHVVNPDPRFPEAVAALKARLRRTILTMSWETSPGTAQADLANLRFVRFAAILDAIRRPVFLLDADSLVRGDLHGLAEATGAADLALRERPANLPLNQRLFTGGIYVQPTEPGLRFMRRLAAYLMGCAARGIRPWYLDQCAAAIILRRTESDREPLRVAPLPEAYLDTNLGEASPVWTGKGAGKAGNRFQTALAAVLARA